MLIGYENPSHVKFISYSGEYPNLCSGILILEIDGKQYKFAPYHDNITIFPKFWSSGGCFSENFLNVEKGEWEIDYMEIPEQFRKYANEIDKVFNENVEYGCCGGCI